MWREWIHLIISDDFRTSFLITVFVVRVCCEIELSTGSKIKDIYEVNFKNEPFNTNILRSFSHIRWSTYTQTACLLRL